MTDVPTYRYPSPSSPTMEAASSYSSQNQTQEEQFDFGYVRTPAQIAVYDDFLSEPRITVIPPAPTTDFIGALAAAVYQQSQAAGGNIAYSVILQVTENFIHARFSEMVVSIYNKGKTIRFSDQGPGFKNKESAMQPGFSSATQPMKRYIKGVGSGLPTVKEWLQVANNGGKLTIEDNLNGGAVVTLTVGGETPDIPSSTPRKGPFVLPSLTDKEKEYILLMRREGALRITDFVEYTGISKGTVSAGLTKLQELRLIENEPGTKRRMLTELGEQAADRLLSTMTKQ